MEGAVTELLTEWGDLDIIVNNVGIGGDDTLFAKIDGTVKFERYDKKRKQISVYSKEA